MQAALDAQTTWLRVEADLSAGNYVYFEARGKLTDPVWPDMSFREMLQLAFRDRTIDSIDHPVLQQLRGEI